MFKPLPLFLGLRYSRSRRRNGFIAFISASSLIGIALGVMDGSLVRYLAEDPSLFLRIIFAISCLFLVFAVPLCLYFLSGKLWESRLRKGAIQHEELPLWARYGLAGWLAHHHEKESHRNGTPSFSEIEATIYD